MQLVGKAGDAAVQAGVPHQRGDVEAVLVVKRAGMIADRDHLEPELMQLQSRIGADIAKALNHGGGIVGVDRKFSHHPLGEMRNAAPRCFAPAQCAAGGDRLAGDDLGHGASLIHRIGVHEPGHHLLVGAHVGCHHVGVRPDERNHLLHVAPRQRLELMPGNGREVDPDAALGAAIGEAYQRAFPAHPDRKRGDLADIDAGGKAGAALGGTEGEVMLHSIAFEHRDGAVVAMNRTGDGDRPFRQQQAIALVHRDRQMIGDHAELVHRHVEHWTGIDRHCRLPFCPSSGTQNSRGPLDRPGTDDGRGWW